MIKSRIRVICTVKIVSILTGMIFAPALVLALPPRPTPRPTGTPTPVLQTPVGGHIELSVHFDLVGPQHAIHWQDLWTVVQWQDANGAWHDVEGWQGGLDDVQVKVNGALVGRKRWWVDKTNLGEGPFRWVVGRKEGSFLFTISDSFSLPWTKKRTTTVEVTLEP